MRKFLSVLFFGGMFLFTACRGAHEKEHDRYNFHTTNPLKKNIKITREYVCQVRSIQHIEIKALEKGYLTQTFIDEGQKVVHGDMLFQVMPKMYEAELQKAEAEAEFAAVEYYNTKTLKNSNIVATSELNLAKAKYDKAKAEQSVAQVQLDFTQIKAPFDGIVGRLMVRQGSLIEEGEILTTLSDNHKMWVYFNVPEAEYLDYENRDEKHRPSEVRLQMANGQIYELNGKITAIEADFNNETGNIAFRATFPNDSGLLRHGQTGNVLMDLPIDDALVIPQKATFEILDKMFVYVLDEENRVRTRAITISSEIPDKFIVSSGLSERDTILLEGLSKVKDGDLVIPNFQDAEKILSELTVYSE